MTTQKTKILCFLSVVCILFLSGDLFAKKTTYVYTDRRFNFVKRVELDKKEKKELHESIRSTYEHQTDPRYAAARLWVDAIIDPAQTREALIWALEAASLNPEVREFKTGVLQT